jgi:RNA polymerase sigma-70 factor (family 1)
MQGNRRRMASKEEKMRLVFDESYHALVYFAHQIVDSRSEAEDIVQDALVKYWNHASEISEDLQAIKSYLYTSVKNTSLNLIRHRTVADKYLQMQSADELFSRDALEMILEAETVSLVFKAMDSLPPACRKIAQLSYLQGKKNDEIAEELGISVNSVKTQKQRGMALLRKKLSPSVVGILLLLS